MLCKRRPYIDAFNGPKRCMTLRYVNCFSARFKAHPSSLYLTTRKRLSEYGITTSSSSRHPSLVCTTHAGTDVVIGGLSSVAG